MTQRTASFGEQLRRFRERAGLTQEDLAEQAGLTGKAIGALERGERRQPYLHTVQALANALRLTDDERAALLLARARGAQPPPNDPPRPAPASTPNPSLAPALLATRVLPPPVRPDAVLRRRLTERIASAPPGGVTLVVAPAGFGKTTLLATWLASLATGQGEHSAVGDAPGSQGATGETLRASEPHTPFVRLTPSRVAWLSLDEADELDPLRLLRYVVAALGRCEPGLAPPLLALLETPQPPSPEALLTVLINQLVALQQPLTLIIDDCHLLRRPASVQALRLLAERLPPTLHLVLASREEPPLPLAKLRAQGRLVELRAADLRFTPREAAAFLSSTMGLALDAAAVGALERRTEGWAAGLQLAALALRNHSDSAAFLSSFTGSHRLLLDYLEEEVLDRLPAHLQAFLLQTAILSRLCGPLCDAVLGLAGVGVPQTADGSTDRGRQTADGGNTANGGENSGRRSAVDAYSQLILDELERANLFLVPLDDERVWYRYHHLFGEVLRARLLRGASPAAVEALHARAAGWYAAQSLWKEAVPHAQAARQWDLASHALERLGEDPPPRGLSAELLALIETLPAQELGARPRLLLLHGICARRELKAREARASFEQALAAYDAAGDLAGRGEALVHLADCQRTLGEYAAAQATLALALACPLPPRPHLNALVSVAWQALASGAWPEVNAALDAALDLVEQHDDRWLRFDLLTNTHLPVILLPGRAPWCERLWRLAAVWDEPSPGQLLAAATKIAGAGRLLRGDLAGARALIAQAVWQSTQIARPDWIVVDLYSFHAALLAITGDLAAADRRYAELQEAFNRPSLATHMHTWSASHRCHLGQLRYLQGRLTDARAIADAMDAAAGPHEWPTAHCARLILRGLLALDDDPATAEALLRAAADEQQRFRNAMLFGDARVPLTDLLLRQGRADEALALAAAALDEHAQYGTPGLLLMGGLPRVGPLLELARQHGLHSELAGRLLAALTQPDKEAGS